MNSITFTQAVDGYLLDANARRLSQHTTRDYTTAFKKFLHFLKDDPPLDTIMVKQVETFLSIQPVSMKTVLNYHIGLSALWTRAVEE
jgi:hypothetical protein